MNNSTTITKRVFQVILFCLVLGGQLAYGQEGQQINTNFSLNTPFHNQLFFNRFLVNPTFSLVRENKSYLNILHRNQYTTFEDNVQNYFVGFSNKLNDHTALGIGVYGQWTGVIQEFGFNANYATSVRLGEKSKLTFGTNLTYLSEGLDKNRVVATENDPALAEAEKESKISIQPGITLSVGKFDFGLYAQELFNYNQSTNRLMMNLNDRSVKASLQYTHSFMATSGLFANARLMPLVQVGRNEDSSLSYIGSLLLDLPEYGWVQTTLDDNYGLSLGLGFNLSKKLSLGYLMEKNFFQIESNLGWNHELSLAYTFKDELPAAYSYTASSEETTIDEVVRNYEEQILQLRAEQNTDQEGGENTLAYENRLILDELILRQDSIESARNDMLEKKFETMVRILRNEMKTKNDSENKYRKEPKASYETAVASIEHVTPISLDAAEHKGFIELPIKVLNQSDIVGVKSGYYLIANVYKNKKWLNAFMKRLKAQGLNAKQFYNKENGLYYVYLADFDMKKDAQTAFVSNLNGKYRDEKWIMQVDNPNTATADVMFED